MLRAILTVVACISLAGCWGSDERIFRDGDWAHVGLEGEYTSEDANGVERARVVIETRPNGLIESTSVEIESGKTEHSTLGLVRIEGGSGRYFLMVDRTDEDGEGDLYMIAHLAERVESGEGDKRGSLEIYWPDCEGTPDMDGLTIDREAFTDAAVCTFSTRSSLMRAGLEAERFLSAKHIVAVQPMGKLVPGDGSDEAE